MGLVDGWGDIEKMQKRKKKYSLLSNIKNQSKIYNSSDERYPIINLDGNIVNCFTGKIQGIYLIEDFIRKKLSL
jgi:hypothetical protein